MNNSHKKNVFFTQRTAIMTTLNEQTSLTNVPDLRNGKWEWESGAASGAAHRDGQIDLINAPEN
jgi:hypothetical protein